MSSPDAPTESVDELLVGFGQALRDATITVGTDDVLTFTTAVAELHVLVPRLSLPIRGYVGTLHAFGPCGAAETAAGDAHDGAGQDDARLRDEVGDVYAADPARRFARMASVPCAGRIRVLSRAE